MKELSEQFSRRMSQLGLGHLDFSKDELDAIGTGQVIVVLDKPYGTEWKIVPDTTDIRDLFMTKRYHDDT